MTASIDLAKFDSFISSRSYVDGHAPTKLDLEVFDAMQSAPEQKHAHALRWYNHIKAIKTVQNPIESEAKATFSSLPFVTCGACSSTCPAKPADDFDLFGEEEESQEDPAVKAAREEKIRLYNEKKAKKPAAVAKSEIVLSIKPWEAETSLDELKQKVLEIQKPGLVWGQVEKVPLAFGVSKLVVKCVVEDESVSVDDLCEEISQFDDYVQSVDIDAFNKL